MEKEGSYEIRDIPRELKKDACINNPVVLIIQQSKDETVFSILGCLFKIIFFKLEITQPCFDLMMLMIILFLQQSRLGLEGPFLKPEWPYRSSFSADLTQ